MPTISQSEYDRILKQIQFAQQQINVENKKKGLPTGNVGGTPTLNAAQIGGASGVGFETADNQALISGQVQEAAEQGRPKSSVGQSNTGGSAPSTMSAAEASYALRGAGLEGLVDSKQFVGLRPAEAQRRIQEEKAKRSGQITANTSFAFNPETIAGTKKIVDRVGIGINDITNQSWESRGTQQDKIKATLDASAKQIAALFKSQEEYNNAVASNPQLQQTLQTFERLGGNAQDIAGKITTPVVAPQEQTTGDYLSNLTNPQANQEAEQKAIDELIPEKAIIQQEIARQQQIPEEIISLYFGTEEQVGILEMKKSQALEEKAILERQERDAETSLKAKAKLAIAKGRAELKVQTATIEKNRLAAKNYMTGMLAKLGALKTTGAAPLALQTLETEYQIATQNLENRYKYQEQEIDIKLNDALNTLETDVDQQILELEQDLTKDYEDITREVLKLQQNADRQIYSLTIKYATLLRQRTTAYTKELKAEAEKYAKSFAKTAGGGLDLKALSNAVEGQYVAGKGVLNPLGEFNKIGMDKSQETEVLSANLQGTDAVKYFLALPPAERRLVMQEAIATGQTMTLARIRALIEESKKKPEPEETTEKEDDFNIL